MNDLIVYAGVKSIKNLTKKTLGLDRIRTRIQHTNELNFKCGCYRPRYGAIACI